MIVCGNVWDSPPLWYLSLCEIYWFISYNRFPISTSLLHTFQEREKENSKFLKIVSHYFLNNLTIQCLIPSKVSSLQLLWILRFILVVDIWVVIHSVNYIKNWKKQMFKTYKKLEKIVVQKTREKFVITCSNHCTNVTWNVIHLSH